MITFFPRVDNVRIAFCLFKYYPFGGLERDFLRIAETCLARGHQVHVFTRHWQGEIPESFQLTFIPTSAFTNHGRAKQFAKTLLQNLALQSFDVVVGFNRLPGLDVYFAADPCYRAQVVKKHSWWYRLLPRYKVYAALEKAVFDKQSHATILLLNPIHQHDFQYYYQTPASRFITLLPGVAHDRKRPENQLEIRQALRDEMHVQHDKKICLMVGSDFKRKGVDRALRALAALPDLLRSKVELWIIGKGQSRIMQNLANELGIREVIKFLGPREDVIRFYAAADCLLHPAYQETAGMVLLEALVAGLPVIVSATCGYAIYIAQARAGVIIPEPFQQAIFNHHVTQLLMQPDALQQYHDNALSFANTHDFFQLAQQVAEVIEHVAKS